MFFADQTGWLDELGADDRIELFKILIEMAEADLT